MDTKYNWQRERMAAAIKLPAICGKLMPTIVTPEVPTACVDGNGRFYVSPTWNPEERGFPAGYVLCHELLHVALQHAERGRGKKPTLWNIATDCVVERILHNLFHWTPPEEFVTAERYNVDPSQPAEVIYVVLESREKNGLPSSSEQQQGDSDPSSAKSIGQSENYEKVEKLKESVGKSQQEQACPRSNTKSILESVGHADKGIAEQNYPQEIQERPGIGKESGNNEETVEAEHGIEIANRILCSNLMGMDGFSYAKPRQGAIIKDVILPGWVGSRSIDVILDTSISLARRDLAFSLGVVNALIRAGYKCRVIHTDTKVLAVEELEQEVDKLTVYGRGGTMLSAACPELQSETLVLLTDGELDDFDVQRIKEHTELRNIKAFVVYTPRSKKRDLGFELLS